MPRHCPWPSGNSSESWSQAAVKQFPAVPRSGVAALAASQRPTHAFRSCPMAGSISKKVVGGYVMGRDDAAARLPGAVAPGFVLPDRPISFEEASVAAAYRRVVRPSADRCQRSARSQDRPASPIMELTGTQWNAIHPIVFSTRGGRRAVADFLSVARLIRNQPTVDGGQDGGPGLNRRPRTMWWSETWRWPPIWPKGPAALWCRPAPCPVFSALVTKLKRSRLALHFGFRHRRRSE
jgi:hypothetical protein